MRKKPTEPLLNVSVAADSKNSLLIYLNILARDLLGKKNKQVIFDPVEKTITIATPMCNKCSLISNSRQFTHHVLGYEAGEFVGNYELKKVNEDVFQMIKTEKEFGYKKKKRASVVMA